MAKSQPPEPSNPMILIPLMAMLLYGIVVFCIHLWLSQVCEIVPEPYLDEVFHIPQAQKYWVGLWQSWDPKITTPPGLYIYSYLFAKFGTVFGDTEVGVRQLRTSVEVLLMIMPGVLLRCHPRYHKNNKWSSTQFAQVMHSNLNIMLCPLLFFFSALYYTDVLSAFVVMEVYRWYVYLDINERKGSYFVSRLSTNAQSTICKLAIFSVGLFAMLVRQTNVFWVAVFLGGLQAVKTLSSATRLDASISRQNAKISANRNTVYDPMMQDAAIEGYALTVFSLISVAPRHILRLINDLLPYLAMLVAFTGFVLWNGGVVLGDKDNHMASIHFPQMLYIWPCIVFFSWPMLLPSIATALQERLPRSPVILTFLGLMSLTVHFNTIVHPFTLADNRHYVFYVFRILLRHPVIKYAAVPLYFVCAWLVINAFGEAPRKDSSKMPPKVRQEGIKDEVSVPLNSPEESTPVSFVLVWLAATSMSLITAPLVEPRYFIVPWLIWRTNLPIDLGREQRFDKSGGWPDSLVKQGFSWLISNRLWIETAWYLIINFVTCYVFLFKGFVWSQEPGKIQRFMW